MAARAVGAVLILAILIAVVATVRLILYSGVSFFAGIGAFFFWVVVVCVAACAAVAVWLAALRKGAMVAGRPRGTLLALVLILSGVVLVAALMFLFQHGMDDMFKGAGFPP